MLFLYRLKVEFINLEFIKILSDEVYSFLFRIFIIYWYIVFQVSEDKEAKKIVDCALKALAVDIKKEMADIQELR